MPRLLAVLVHLASVAVAAGAATAATPLEQRLAKLLDQHPSARRTNVALKVVDLADNRVLFDRHGERLFIPASNLKIYTAACAFDLFDPRHRFATDVLAAGPIVDGELQGNLVIVGGGDSMLAAADLRALATRVVAVWGLRTVRGRVVADNSRYAPRLKGPGWMWDDDPGYYNMSVTPLMLDFNVLTVKSPPRTDGPPLVVFAPPSNPRPTVPGPAPAATEIAITRRPFTEPIVVRSPPSGGSETKKALTMHDPGPWVAGVFQGALESRGVKFKSPLARQADDPTAAESSSVVLATRELSHSGRTLVEAINHFQAVSENAVGEALLHEIAIRRGVERPDWPDGAAAIANWLTTVAGLDPGSFRIVDGSGLSRYNLVSADSAVRLLAFMHTHRRSQEFFDSLPRYKLADATADDAAVVIAAKPGGMQSVSTISGYLKTRTGRLLAFSLLANGYIGSNEPILDLRQKVWRELASTQD